MQDQGAIRWCAIGASVRGAAHERLGAPNQDAIGWKFEVGDQLPLVIAVADGHGSRKCFRSDIGAKFAVEEALAELREAAIRAAELPSLSAAKRMAEDNWPRLLTQRWAERVASERAERPFTEAELAALVTSDGESARRVVEQNPLLAYGSTLIAVVVTSTFLVYIQLGDGDILTVSEAGEVSRPLPADVRLFANETTSLCSHQAWREFRLAFQVVHEAPPALILCSSDGYAGSFRSEADFLRVGSDLLEIIRTDGVEVVEQQLGDWLTEASRLGSGDDVSLGIVYRALSGV